MGTREELADWQTRVDLLLAEREPDLTRLEDERYAAAIAMIGDSP